MQYATICRSSHREVFCKKGVLICQEGLSLLLPFSCHQNRSIFPGGKIYVRTPMDFPGESCSHFPRKTLHFQNSSKIARKPNHLQNRCDFPRKPNMPIFPEQLNLTGRWDNTRTGAFFPGRWNNIRTAKFDRKVGQHQNRCVFPRKVE